MKIFNFICFCICVVVLRIYLSRVRKSLVLVVMWWDEWVVVLRLSEGNPFPLFSNHVLGLCCFSILEIDIIMSIDCLMCFFLG